MRPGMILKHLELLLHNEWRYKLLSWWKKKDFETQIKWDDFKAALAKFISWINIVQKNLDFYIKNKEAQAIKIFQALKIQSKMIHGLDKKFIICVKGKVNLGHSSCTIALNSSQKYMLNRKFVVFKNVIYLSETIEKSMVF